MTSAYKILRVAPYFIMWEILLHLGVVWTFLAYSVVAQGGSASNRYSDQALLLRVPLFRSPYLHGDADCKQPRIYCAHVRSLGEDGVGSSDLAFFLYLSEESLFSQYERFCAEHGLCGDPFLVRVS